MRLMIQEKVRLPLYHGDSLNARAQLLFTKRDELALIAFGTDSEAVGLPARH